jgi:hypothetical protein
MVKASRSGPLAYAAHQSFPIAKVFANYREVGFAKGLNLAFMLNLHGLRSPILVSNSIVVPKQIFQEALKECALSHCGGELHVLPCLFLCICITMPVWPQPHS